MEPLYKCIWMSAGILSFRLCDREYDCEHCLVDMALRERSPHAADLSAKEIRDAAAITETASFQASSHAFYHPCHLWVRVGSGGTVRVGLDSIASSLLKRLREIRLPQPGASLHRGHKAWTFVGDAGECDLPSPVSGRLLSRNEDLISHPETLHERGRRESWLARIRPARLSEDLETLTYGRRAAEWLSRELQKIRGHLLDAHALSTGSLPDGGSVSPMVLDGIDLTLRRALVEEILLAPTRRQKGR